MPLWFGTKSRIIRQSKERSSSASCLKPTAPPSSGFTSVKSVTS